ncbi:MAG: CPBP family glutamic-type intramembrane protease [Planctomycetota bacterium]
MNESQLSRETPVDRRLILACVLPGLVLPFFASLVYFVFWAGSTGAMIIYAATKLFTVVWPVLFIFLVLGYRFQRRKINWSKHLSALPLGAVTGLLIGGVIVGAYSFTPLGGYVEGFADEIGVKVADMGISGPVGYVLFCTFLAGLHSLIEEFYWRWFIFGRLAEVWPVWLAYFLGSLGFAGHHYVVLGCYFSPMGAFAFGTLVGVGGALWCWMLRRQGTLAGCWLSHALVDAAVFYVGYRIVFM